jgi:ribosomal protein S18 acetylase RimI-like enzyme
MKANFTELSRGKQVSQRDEVQHLTEQQLPQAIPMLGRAFHNDPLSVYIYPDETERKRRLPLMFEIALHYSLRYGEITTTPDTTGAACWLPPESATVRIGRLLRVGALNISLKMGVSAMRRMSNAEDYMKEIHQRCLAGPHWYLWVLGVEPAHQGQGIGGRLLRAGLARADASHLPCYLETMNPNNVPLYQKFGFTITSEGNIPGSSVRMWGMVRPITVQL